MKEEKEQGERERGEREKQGVRRCKRMLLKTNVKKEKEKGNSAQHAVKADHYESINA